MRDLANLDARTIEPQRVLDSALNRAVVPLLFHVDEVDNDKTCKIAQFKLSRDLVGRLKVGIERRLFNGVLTRRLARVYVDGNQRFSLIDDDIPTGFERHMRAEHRIELPLDLDSAQTTPPDRVKWITFLAWLGIIMRMKSCASS